MIKKSKNKTRSNKRTGKDGKATIVQLSEGWTKINKVGIQPFFERVENIDDKNKLKKIAMDTQQYIEVYDTIFTMCIQREPHNFSGQLYVKHSEALTKQFKSKFLPSLSSKKKESSVIFLREWDKRWRCCKWNVIGMTRMFMYLDRFHVPNSQDLLNTTQQGYTIYRECVFSQFKDIAKTAILSCIERERNGEEQDRDLLRDSIAVFVELGNKLKKVELEIYKNDFNKHLLFETRQYYKLKSREQLDILTCPKYLIFAEKCIHDEISRLSNYIDKYSEHGLMEVVRNELLKIHQKELLLDKKTGIHHILNRTVGTADVQSAKEDLLRLYKLYSEVGDGLFEIAKAIKLHITDLGINYIEKSKNAGNNVDAHELMTQLINLHDRFLNIVKNEFGSEGIFHVALKDAFECFINKEYYVSGLLAKYANDLLKKGNKLSSRSTLEQIMDHVVMIYGYIRDKDIFERDYQLYLSSRLLQNLSENEQSERSMIGKLKNEAGYHWTSKLESMFKDIQTSKELMNSFKKSKIINIESFQCQLNVSICTTGSWPDSSINPIKIPYEDIGGISDAFKTYYLSRFNGRKLRYQMDKGKADVQIIFNNKNTSKKILVVTTYQMVVLLLFNNKKTITFKEMKDLTNINSEDLEIAVLSMAHPKIKVLRKAPNTKELNDNHKFQINPNYSNPKTRIIIPILSIKNNNHKNNLLKNKIDPKILTQRRYQMDAAIVRTMKTRKTFEHKELIAEVVKQLIKRFNPKPQLIKKRIIALIEQDYLERDKENRNIYHYIS